jgi:hypothetical protein
MTRILLITWLLAQGLNAAAQEARLPDGLWQAGTTGRISPLDESSAQKAAGIRLERELVLVDLHPGFAVVKSEYRFSNPSDSALSLTVGIPSSGHFSVKGVGRCSFFGNESPLVSSNGKREEVSNREKPPMNPLPAYDSVMAHRYHSWVQRFEPGVTTVTVYLTTQNHLSRLVRGDSARDGNAFGYVTKGDRHWPGESTVSQVLVRLHGELYLTGIRAALPDGSFMGNLRHLRWSGLGDSSKAAKNLLVWYEGAPPDFKYEKKVLGSIDTLYRMMDAFPLGDFDEPSFQPVSRSGLDVSKTGVTPAGIAYFIMFFIPWIVLLFIIFQLLRKGKKRETASKEENQSPDPSKTWKP